jgi:hypothetical protein
MKLVLKKIKDILTFSPEIVRNNQMVFNHKAFSIAKKCSSVQKIDTKIKSTFFIQILLNLIVIQNELEFESHNCPLSVIIRFTTELNLTYELLY